MKKLKIGSNLMPRKKVDHAALKHVLSKTVNPHPREHITYDIKTKADSRTGLLNKTK